MADGTRTDPRYHAAYQRGYDGPEPERLTRAEERFRRPRRAAVEAAPVRERRAPASAPAHEPDTAPAFEPAPALDPAQALGFSASAEPPAAETDAVAPPPRSVPLGRSIPLTLLIVGVVLAAVGSAGIWWWTNSIYGYTVYVDGVDPEQYLRLVLQYTSAPALTIGLLCLVGSAVAQLLRASRS